MVDNDIVSICKLDKMKELNTLGMSSHLSHFIFSSSMVSMIEHGVIYCVLAC